MWEHPEKEKLTSDHWALFGQMEVGMDIGSQVRKVIDWEAVEYQQEKKNRQVASQHRDAGSSG